MFFGTSLRLSKQKVLHNIAFSSGSFLDFARIFSLFSLIVRTSNFWSLRNLIKQLFHSRSLNIRLSQKSVFFGVQWGGKTDFSHLQRAIFYRPDFRSAVCPGVWQQ